MMSITDTGPSRGPGTSDALSVQTAACQNLSKVKAQYFNVLQSKETILGTENRA